MSNNSCSSFVGPTFGWTMELINPLPPFSINQVSNVFSYKLIRDLNKVDGMRFPEMSNIRFEFCDIEGLELIDCSLEITYVNPDEITDPPITKVFPDSQFPKICEVDNNEIVFEPIPSGNEVNNLPIDYEQKIIVLTFKFNKELLIGQTSVDLKAGQNTWTFDICGFLCKTPPPKLCRGLRIW